MLSDISNGERHLRQLRLFLEEVCCDLCRLGHVAQDGLAPEDVTIDQEVSLGVPGAFADIRVKPAGLPHYFFEVRYGYPPGMIIAQLTRKYGTKRPILEGASKVIVVVDDECHRNWPEIQRRLESGMQGLRLEVWDEEHLLALIRERFGLEIGSISKGSIDDLRTALDNAKGQFAFGDEWANDAVQSSLLWQFGFWRLKHLREKCDLSPESILSSKVYKGVVVLMADLCSFSSYVRDTPDSDVIHHCLTTFYSKSRYEILDTGGMLYQFVGDEVIGLYGIPEQSMGCVQDAMECAKALVDVGSSVSNRWQRQIDRIQKSQGVHIGMALGNVQVVSLRPFDQAHVSTISDGINMTSRLLAQAGPGEIVASNALYQKLDQQSQAGFEELEPVDARNLGTIRAWKMHSQKGARS